MPSRAAGCAHRARYTRCHSGRPGRGRSTRRCARSLHRRLKEKLCFTPERQSHVPAALFCHRSQRAMCVTCPATNELDTPRSARWTRFSRTLSQPAIRHRGRWESLVVSQPVEPGARKHSLTMQQSAITSSLAGSMSRTCLSRATSDGRFFEPWFHSPVGPASRCSFPSSFCSSGCPWPSRCEALGKSSAGYCADSWVRPCLWITASASIPTGTES